MSVGGYGVCLHVGSALWMSRAVLCWALMGGPWRGSVCGLCAEQRRPDAGNQIGAAGLALLRPVLETMPLLALRFDNYDARPEGLTSAIGVAL